MAQRDWEWHGQWRCLSWPAGGPGASGLRAGWMEARRWVVDQMPGFRSYFHTDLKGRFLVVCMCVFSGVSVFATSCTVAWQAPLPMELFRQEYWRAMPFPPAGHLPNPGIKPVSPAFPALASGLSPALRGKPELLVEETSARSGKGMIKPPSSGGKNSPRRAPQVRGSPSFITFSPRAPVPTGDRAGKSIEMVRCTLGELSHLKLRGSAEQFLSPDILGWEG